MPSSTSAQLPSCLRQHALHLLQINDTQAKATAVRALDAGKLTVNPTLSLVEPAGLPGRPTKPELLPANKMPTRAVGTRLGHAALIHALTHIEANAINLALDILWRFAGMPDAFYRDWWRVASEEALHFQLLQAHLKTLGFSYGDFSAHDGLWEMAHKTRADLLARLALVPRTLEARGLDATPAVRNRLVSVGDQQGAQILDIILHDEIVHVSIGNHWFQQLCAQRNQDPVRAYAELAQHYDAPVLKGPFNLAARRAAGFTEVELAALCVTPPPN